MAAIPTILKGDDSGAITINIASGRTYTGATLVVAYQGVTRSFTNLTPGGTVSLTFTHDETAGFALKTAPILMRLIGQYGAEETVENADARIRVTDCLAEVNAGGSFIVQPGGTMVDPTKVPITEVGDVAARYTLADLQAKVNQIVRVLAQRSLLALGGVALLAWSAFGALDVQTARLDSLYNDALVVTNVSGSSGITANDATNIANYRVEEKVATWALKPNPEPVTDLSPAINYTTAVSNDMVTADADRYTKSEADGRFVASAGGKVAFANVTNKYGNAVSGSDIKLIEGSETSLATAISGKADAATTLSGYGITDAKIVDSMKIKLGSDEITPMVANGGIYAPNIEFIGKVTMSGNTDVYGSLKRENAEIVYGISTNGENYLHADVNLAPFGDGILSQARADSQSMVGGISNKLEYIEGYMAGQRVRISVTNYYGNTSGDLPRLRIEEFITATNVVDGVDVETNYWQMVWDENNKYQQFYTNTTIAVSGMTNDLYQTYYALLQERVNTKAPRAWGTLTSAGEAAPVGTVWHTEPNTVFAGGTEYAHAMVGTGVIGVLTSRGAAIYTDGEIGRFHFTTDDKTHYFGMNIASRYELGCDTDGITVTQVGGNNMVELLYNVTMSGKPILYYKPTLTNAWSQITDSTGAAVPGAPVYASWEQSPPAGSEICNINAGTGLSGFLKAGIEYDGSSKFETNMMADLAGGIIATNQTTNQMQPVEPYISNGQVLWRIKQ